MPIKLTHETAPYIARSIVESGSFIAGPILGDAGMNAYIENGFYYCDKPSGAARSRNSNGRDRLPQRRQVV
jgi:hypothetical protein